MSIPKKIDANEVMIGMKREPQKAQELRQLNFVKTVVQEISQNPDYDSAEYPGLRGLDPKTMPCPTLAS